ncbi:MAG TPA: dinitrogenase iron-molybdenum cofactor biosynthesis protein [Polyangiaceae bacterium]|nr:dinitrogenase iron-molybdenum cofactor biosynthesis protein [Polyangiaceae bacterium]
MEQPPISNEVALRIGLASRVLPEVSAGDLIEALQETLGEQLDEQSLSQITVTHLKKAFGQAHDVDGDEENERDMRQDDIAAFKEAVRILWGENPEQENLPKLDPYQPGDMPGSVRVAVASNDAEELNGHFGSCTRFLIYQVSASELRLVGVRSTLLADRSDDKNAFRVGLISDCRILYVVHVGGPAAAKVIKADIHIIPVPDGGAAREVLAKLQGVIGGAPPPWLKKALAQVHES